MIVLHFSYSKNYAKMFDYRIVFNLLIPHYLSAMFIHSYSYKNTSMKGLSILLFFSIALFLVLTSSAAIDRISANQEIQDGDTIVSQGEKYELGFFSPGKSKNRYLGIWFKKITPRTVVWVANRENPVTSTSGLLRVTSEGALLLLQGGDTIIWSSNSSVFDRNIDPVAQLLDTGNLVVRDENLIWQSFDYPGDTLLPGMKFGKDLVTGVERHLTSWKNPEDPSPGQYVMWMDTSGFPQAFERRGPMLSWRLGPWNGVKFSGFPRLSSNPIYRYNFVFNQQEVYYKYELVNSSLISRMHLNPEGRLLRLNWIDQTQDWFLIVSVTIDSCSLYGLCGTYGSCNINNFPACICIEGFEPKYPDEWNADNWSKGCRRKKPLDCRNGDGFRKISGVKLPDTRNSWYNLSMTLGECEMACKRNCSCTAYTNIFIANGFGCLLWFDDLMDIRDDDENQDLYIRMAASELSAPQSGSDKSTRVLAMALSVSSMALVLVGLSLAFYPCNKKKKWIHMKGRGSLVHVQDEDLEIPFFSLSKIKKATKNFLIENKLGEGGFGPVYKGVLEEGREIAVKRLSDTSQQGLDEFQNEVICIAKLQHRNLVKLLGYCIHGDERILIYEYMPNKSLDYFLFDETKRSILGWTQRFCIIHGIARGLLYLHQDSSFQVIHRDLKAGNILLDEDMNPKISDFGLARRFRGNDATDKTKKVVGTYGYIPPEYAVHGRFSIKSDVFSFGVLVLEIVSGRKNREFSHEDHSDNLLGHAWRLYKEDKSIDLICESLRDSCIISEILRSIHVGLLCVQHHPQDRPTMLSVVLMLASDGALTPPKEPAFFTKESCSREVDSVSSVDEAMITLLYAR